MTLQVELAVPDGEIWSGQATMVIAKTLDGDIGVLTGHAPVLGILAEGSVVRIRPEEDGGQEVRAAVSSGFFSIADDRVSILAHDALLSADIDASAARAALDAALGEAASGERGVRARPLLPGPAAGRRLRVLADRDQGTGGAPGWQGWWRSSRAGRCSSSWPSRPWSRSSWRPAGSCSAAAGGTVECGLRATPAAAWRLGLAAYQPDQLYWFSAFGLRLRPNEVFDRRSLHVLARRPAAPAEVVSIGAGTVVVECQTERHRRPARAPDGRAGHERGGPDRLPGLARVVSSGACERAELTRFV